MALTHLLYPLFLSSLLVLASAHSDYVSTQNFPNVDTQPNGNNYLGGSHVKYLNLDHLLDHNQPLDNHDHLLNHDQLLDNHDNLIPTNSKPEYVHDPNTQGTENVVDQVEQGGQIPNTIHTIGIQGVILCKKGDSKYVPLSGAVTRVTCPNYSYKNGQKYYEDIPSSILSCETDGNGFFQIRFLVSQLLKGLNVKDCKVFLEHSRDESCNVPTNVNNGLNGANLSLLHNFIADKLYYTAGPFIYTSNTNNDQYQYSAPSPAGY